MKQVIVLVAMIIVGLTLFTGIVGLNDNTGEAVTAANDQIEMVSNWF